MTVAERFPRRAGGDDFRHCVLVYQYAQTARKPGECGTTIRSPLQRISDP